MKKRVGIGFKILIKEYVLGRRGVLDEGNTEDIMDDSVRYIRRCISDFTMG